jgi:hypothetical protein
MGGVYVSVYSYHLISGKRDCKTALAEPSTAYRNYRKQVFVKYP